jgi:hypothetical protein
MSGNVAKQIIGSFEDIGKSVIEEAAKVPVDITGKALESLGVKSGKNPQNQKTITSLVSGSSDQSKNKDGWDKIDNQKDQHAKQVIARQALLALSDRGKSKEPSVWERLQKEAEQKKEQEKIQATATAMSSVPQTGSKRARGDLYGLKAKKSSAEIGKNVKSD